MFETLKTIDLPADIAGILKGVGYRKKSVLVAYCGRVEPGSQQWSGGTREHTTIFDRTTTTAQPIVDKRSWPANMGAMDPVELDTNEIAIKLGTFNGRPSFAKITIPPSAGTI